MGPIARGVLVVTWGRGDLFGRVCPDELLDFWAPAKKAGPPENENWVDNVWKFQLLRGAHRPMGFWRYRMGVGIYSGGSSPMSY